jgi:adenine-specific DNA-methyltransferase
MKGMVHILHLLNSESDIFISKEKSLDYINDILGFSIGRDILLFFIDNYILSQFSDNKLILKDDIISIQDSFKNIRLSNQKDYYNTLLLGINLSDNNIHLFNNSWIDFGAEGKSPIFYAALRNLFSDFNSFASSELVDAVESYSYHNQTKIVSPIKEIKNYITEQINRANILDTINISQFTNSAYYMGSKKALGGFLVEAISSVLPDDGVLVDLMCGSGGISGVFNKYWDTYSSDAQQFSQILAMIHGGGFSVSNAQSLLNEILPIAHSHATELYSKLKNYIDKEDKVFHGEISEDLLLEYQRYIDSFPTYPDGGQLDWDPISEVLSRKKNPNLYPYCLFTTYFSNIYFGLRQSVEIDSLRYAIDQIECEKAKKWALGTLITTLSALGTSYGGHFAQPKIKTSKDLNMNNFLKVIEKRSHSIIHEFNIRFLKLSSESEKTNRSITIIPGPWQTTLSHLDKLNIKRPIVIYMDAPYKREEYSRYYHVLETLVNYQYHSCVGIGKIPDKQKGERFQSEFFTRKNDLLNEAFINLIEQILNRGWICAWSYSNSGSADIVLIIERIKKNKNCIIKTFSTPYRHVSQRGKKPKQVVEYLIVFIPKNG